MNALESLSPTAQNLYYAQIKRQWFTITVLWLIFLPFGLWTWRDNLSLIHDYFTWSAIRYALAFHLGATLGLSFCLGMTLGLLLRQSIHILRGLSDKEKYYLEQQIAKSEEG